MAEAVGVALVGAGAFGEFCLAAFAKLPQVRIAAVVDINAERAQRFAAQYAARPYTRLDDALSDPHVQIIALNTPPYLHTKHYPQVEGEGKISEKKGKRETGGYDGIGVWR